MKKYLFLLAISFISIPVLAQQDSKYLKGAVPEVNGKVVFERNLQAKTLSQREIFEIVSGWAEQKFEMGDGFRRKLLTKDSTKYEIHALGDEYIVFEDKLLSLDRARFMYVFLAKIVDGSCEITFNRLHYYYRAGSDDFEKLTAEEMITDKNALKKGKMIKSTAKFRIKTIDCVDGICAEIQNLLNARVLEKIN